MSVIEIRPNGTSTPREIQTPPKKEKGDDRRQRTALINFMSSSITLPDPRNSH